MADTSLLGTGIFLAAFGVVTGAIALKVQRDHRLWCAGKTRVTGVVSRLAQRRTNARSGPSQRLVPMVRFRATNGVEYEVEADEIEREVGIPVEIAYDPALPSDGRAVKRVPKVGLPVLMILFGVVLAAVAASRPD